MSTDAWLIQGVIFDIGGVLAFDVQEHLFAGGEHSIAAKYHLDLLQVQSVSAALWNKYAYDVLTDNQDWRALERRYWNDFLREMKATIPFDDLLATTDEFIKPVVGMPQLLEALYEQGLDLIITTNNTEFWFQRQKAKLNLDRYIAPEAFILSCRIGFPKSSAGFELFSAAADVMRFDRARYVLIDDRFENIARANAFGLAGILFPTASPEGSAYISRLLRLCGFPLP